MKQVDTMEKKSVARRKDGRAFNTENVSAIRHSGIPAFRQSGVPVAGIALHCGLNCNVVCRWLREDAVPIQANTHAGGAVGEWPNAQFMAVQLPQPSPALAPSTDIRVELRRGTSSITVSWPLKASALARPGCAGGCDDPH